MVGRPWARCGLLTELRSSFFPQESHSLARKTDLDITIMTGSVSVYVKSAVGAEGKTTFSIWFEEAGMRERERGESPPQLGAEQAATASGERGRCSEQRGRARGSSGTPCPATRTGEQPLGTHGASSESLI